MPAQWKKERRRYPHTPGIDSYANWALGAGRKQFFASKDQQEWILAMVRLKDISAREFAKGEQFIDDPTTRASWKSSVRVPGRYLEQPTGREDTYCTALVTEKFFELMANNAKIKKIAPRITLGSSLKTESLFKPASGPPKYVPAEPPVGKPTEQGTVVIGIIDDGIAFAHDRFRRADGKTRVESVWLQDGVYKRPVRSFEYGREISKRDEIDGIDALLGKCNHAGIVDEDEIYLRTGLINYRRPGHRTAGRRVAHGTHVMDLACGFDPSYDRDDRPVVCVQLPAATTADTSGSGLDPFVSDAIEYILDCADAIAQQRDCGALPVVINFSYGTIAGPHDGTSDLEARVDELVNQSKLKHEGPLAVVLPSGNSRLSRCHAQFSLSEIEKSGAEGKELQWRVLPDDKTASFLEIWLPHRVGEAEPAGVRVAVTLPGGTEKPVALEQDPDLVLQWKKSNGDVLCEVSYDNVPSPTERGRFLVALQPTTYIDQPTANIESGNSLAPSGAWLINIEKSEKQVGDLNDDENPLLHAWVQRDETLYGHPRRGRQSFFSDDCYERFDHGGREIDDDEHREQPLCHIKREGLINALATGKKTVVVGGYFEKEMVSANYSAGGPVTPSPGSPNAHRDGPDAVAVSDQSRVHRGVLAAGSRSGTVVAMSGTSVAAPQVTRLIADRLAKRKSGNRDAVKELVERGGGRHSKKREGEGRIPRPKRIKFSRVWD